MVRGLKQWQSVVLTVIVTSMINFAFFALHFDQSNEQNFEVAPVLTDSQTRNAFFADKKSFQNVSSSLPAAYAGSFSRARAKNTRKKLRKKWTKFEKRKNWLKRRALKNEGELKNKLNIRVEMQK